MLTIYEKMQLNLVKKWQYIPHDVIRKSQDIVSLPKPSFFLDYLPFDAVDRVLSMLVLERNFLYDKEEFVETYKVSLEKIKKQELEFSDSLAETVCSDVELSDLREASPDVITEFLYDIPEIVSRSLCFVHRIGLCYGYEYKAKSEVDKFYLISALLSICKNSIAETVEMVPNVLAKLDIRQLSIPIACDITMRKFAVRNPYLKIFLGKSAARWYFREIGIAAKYMFQKRWLMDHGKWA